MLKGRYIGLRAIERSDLALMQIWRNNATMRKFYREYRELNSYDQERWFDAICCGNPNFCMFAIVTLESLPQPVPEYGAGIGPGSFIGVCGLTNIHWVLRSAELSFYIGAGDAYVDSTYAPEAVSLMCSYAFDILGMHKVWAEIYEYDTAKIALFETMNMHKDGILRDNAFCDGKYFDSFVYSLLHSEFLTKH